MAFKTENRQLFGLCEEANFPSRISSAERNDNAQHYDIIKLRF